MIGVQWDQIKDIFRLINFIKLTDEANKINLLI